VRLNGLAPLLRLGDDDVAGEHQPRAHGFTAIDPFAHHDRGRQNAVAVDQGGHAGLEGPVAAGPARAHSILRTPSGIFPKKFSASAPPYSLPRVALDRIAGRFE